MKKKLGYCIGSTKPNRVFFITDKTVKIGEFVFIEYEEEDRDIKVLGMIQSLHRENPYLPETTKSREQVEGIKRFSGKDITLKGDINILGEIVEDGDKANLKLLKTPPPPAADVYEADPDILKKLFGAKDKRFIRIGKLLSQDEDVPVYINVEQIVLRHLAILAITGAGKSNTVSVLLQNILNLNGTVLVFDFHGEYVKSEFKKGGKNRVNIIEPIINPALLKPKEFASLVGIKPNAYIQLRYFKLALEHLINELEGEKGKNWQNYITTEEFLNRLKETVDSIRDEDSDIRQTRLKGKPREESLYEVLNKIEEMELELGHIIKLGAKPIIEKIKDGYINVIDFSEIDEETADTICSNILMWSLEERKKAVRRGDTKLKKPLLIVIEEAHILAGDKRNTQSKYYISRIAREGRKFGLGLVIITQRPKGLDKEILSQMNNMIILKLVEPEDQKHVQSASEALSQELMSYLPSLNPGEAIIIGNMTRIPLLVKIDKAEGKIEGNDIPVVEEWQKEDEEEKKIEEDVLDFLEEI
ncbi:MAG: ATP-binding protein [Persephonella sp.]|nr:MAG: ATP-binding protein [Persephonella sp.]